MPSTASDVERLLLSRGWDKVGEGHYAEVYSKPEMDYVLKVFERDSAYMEYLRLISQHRNSHFPRIKGLMWLRDENAKYNAVRIEKLEPYRSVEVDGVVGDFLSGMLNAYLIGKSRKLNSYQEGNLELAKLYLTDKPELVEALDLIAETRRLNNLYYDVSPHNIMFRGDTPVIIDPYHS